MMQFLDYEAHKHRIRTTRIPETWTRLEVQCPACRKIFVAHVSPREDPREGMTVARVRLIRTCPHHQQSFWV